MLDEDSRFIAQIG